MAVTQLTGIQVKDTSIGIADLSATGSPSATTYLRGDNTWAALVAINTGTTTLDFGNYPGKLDTSIAVTGQTGILSGSIVSAWIRPATTAKHSIDEHIMAADMLAVIAGNIVAGTGFTIYGLAKAAAPGIGGQDGNFRNLAVPISRLYGTFTIAWSWV